MHRLPGKRQLFVGSLFLAVGIMLAACNGSGTQPPAQPTSTQTASATPISAAQPSTALPTEPAENPGLQLTIWWPEALAPIDRTDITNLLNQQIEAFSVSEDVPVDIEFRLKRTQDVGGIMSTLRTAKNVAPGALPDVTLIRRDDLVAAVRDQLVFPLEGLIPVSILGNTYDAGLDLGQVDGVIYGLPYLLDTRIVAYHQERGAETTSANWSFEEVLERGEEWIFPASRVGGIGNILYVQYLDAGGRAPAASIDTFQVNPEALFVVFDFYEQAIEQGVISERVLDYTSYDAYVPDLVDENLNNVVLTSNRFIQLRSQGAEVYAAPIPTASGQPSSLVDGWIWVLTTSNADQQALAASFINWMMAPARQQQYAEVTYMLPSQQAPLQNYNAELLDVSLFNAILSGSVRIPSDTNSIALARAMQNALVAMLTEDSSAEDAVESIINQFSG